MAEVFPVWFKCSQCGVQVRTEAAEIDYNSRSYLCPKCGGRTETRDIAFATNQPRHLSPPSEVAPGE